MHGAANRTRRLRLVLLLTSIAVTPTIGWAGSFPVDPPGARPPAAPIDSIPAPAPDSLQDAFGLDSLSRLGFETGRSAPTAPDTLRGSWERLEFPDPEPRDTPTIVFDSRRGRLLMFGGFDDWSFHNETWEFDPSDPYWRRLPIDGPLPAARSRHVAVYDPGSDAMIVYGGWAGGDSRLGDVWSLDLGDRTWRELVPANGPRPVARRGSEGALDQEHHRLLIASGEANPRMLNDAWAFSLDSLRWQTIRPETRGNLARERMAMAYDSRRNQWLGFGGSAGDGVHNELWSWDVARRTGWTPMDYADEGPVAMISPSAVYDPVRDQLVVFGGSGYPFNAMQVSTIALSGEIRAPRLHPQGVPIANLFGSAAIYDPVHDRVLMFSANGFLWQLSLGADMRWAPLLRPYDPNVPKGRAYAASVYDTRHRRWVLMFGWDGIRALGDIWTYDLTSGQWQQIPYTPIGPWPGGLFGAAAAYDAKRDRILLFGGNDGIRVNQDSWELRLDAGTLTHLTPPTYAFPLKRTFASAFYDTSRDEMMVFGGSPEGPSSDANAYAAVAYYDAWSLQTIEPTVATWTQWEFPEGIPHPNGYGSCVYDPDGRQLVLEGGLREDRLLSGGWAITPTDPQAEWRVYGQGLTRDGLSAVYDPGDKRMVLFGGNVGDIRVNDLWQLHFSTYPPLDRLVSSGTPPPARFLHAACFDTQARRMFVFGGAAYQATNTSLFGDLWELDLAGTPTWKQLAESPLYPEQRSNHAAIYDAPRNRMLVFGGSTLDDAVWALPLDGPLRWTRLPVQGVSPGWRLGPGLVYDSRRDRLIVSGGSRGRDQPLKDVWALSLTGTPVWTPIVPRDALPEGGENSSTIYDARRDVVVTFGGDATTHLRRFEYPHYRPGAFALSLQDPTWRSLKITGGPVGNRTNQATVFDRVRQQIVSFGGLDDRIGSTCDTWSIVADDSSFTYTPLDPCSGPGQYYSPTAVIDPWADQVVLYGGDSRVWVRPLDNERGWMSVAITGPTPSPRIEHSAVFDTRHHRMLVYGGAYGSTASLDLWQFTYTDRPGRREGPLSLRTGFDLAVAASPAHGLVVLDFTLTDRQPGTIELFDLAGRRVAQRDIRSLGSGHHRLSLSETSMLPPGVYLVRMSRGGQAKTSRIVLLR